MALRLSTSDAQFAKDFARLLHARGDAAAPVAEAVAVILNAVKERGDAALKEYTRRFDRWEADALRVQPQEVANAVALCTPELMKSLKTAAQRIEAFSKRQMPEDAQWRDEAGVTLGWKWTALDAVGLYVPGGLASYPSSVLMNAVPARTAGIKRLAMAVPAPEGRLNPAVLAAAYVAGIEEIYKIGGAQAVGAFAYGTESIAPVDKIVGPGNAYVAEAKRQVFGVVGIDMIAGPSEILVVADGKNDPAWIAADLLSQAEHDADAQSVLITDDAQFAATVEKAVDTLLEKLPRRAIAEQSWRNHGVVVVVRDMEEAPPLIDALAPEHLELAVEAPETLAKAVRHAGAIFLGRHTPEAVGDYLAGPSHVLPTSRNARFASGLSVFDFLKRTSIASCTPESFASLADYGWTLAEAEGLHAHALSFSIRKGNRS